MSTSGGSLQKAVIASKDKPSKTLTVQYNPTNFQFTKPVQWKEHDDQGEVSKLEFQKNSPATMSCELTFDTTADGSDVRSTYVDLLLSFTNPEIDQSGEGEGSELAKKRPHKVTFTWGTFYMLGVFESVDVAYTMFATDGNPLRAKVSLKMKEWTSKQEYTGSQGSAGYGMKRAKLVTVGAGDTVTSIAAAQGTTAQAICDANDISDPLNIQVGVTLAVFF